MLPMIQRLPKQVHSQHQSYDETPKTNHWQLYLLKAGTTTSSLVVWFSHSMKETDLESGRIPWVNDLVRKTLFVSVTSNRYFQIPQVLKSEIVRLAMNTVAGSNGPSRIEHLP